VPKQKPKQEWLDDEEQKIALVIDTNVFIK